MVPSSSGRDDLSFLSAGEATPLALFSWFSISILSLPPPHCYTTRPELFGFTVVSVRACEVYPIVALNGPVVYLTIFPCSAPVKLRVREERRNCAVLLRQSASQLLRTSRICIYEYHFHAELEMDRNDY